MHTACGIYDIPQSDRSGNSHSFRHQQVNSTQGPYGKAENRIACAVFTGQGDLRGKQTRKTYKRRTCNKTQIRGPSKAAQRCCKTPLNHVGEHKKLSVFVCPGFKGEFLYSLFLLRKMLFTDFAQLRCYGAIFPAQRTKNLN